MTETIKNSEAMRKVVRLNEHLERRFGLLLDLDSVDHLTMVKEHYDQKRGLILSRYGIFEALNREDYAKAVMISEAIAMFLREIAPKRTKPRTRRKEQS
jgi:hypothetical protein